MRKEECEVEREYIRLCDVRVADGEISPPAENLYFFRQTTLSYQAETSNFIRQLKCSIPYVPFRFPPNSLRNAYIQILRS